MERHLTTDGKGKLTLLRRVPSLIALRAFDSVARFGSCTKAANELNVSVAAVSQQIRLLEEFAGRELFRRHKGQLILNDAGASCLPELRKSFSHLIAAMEQLGSAQVRRRFNVSVAGSFAVRWLVPHFKALNELADGYDLWVTTALTPFHLADTSIDLAIIHGDGNFFGQKAELLLPSLEIPVCAPEVFARAPLRQPADLSKHTLLHEIAEVDDPAVPSWDRWLQENDATDVACESGPRFSNPNLVIEAAIAGVGIALSRGALVQGDIEAGRLVQLFGNPKPGSTGYWVVCNERSEHAEFAKRFAEELKRLVQPAPSAARAGRGSRAPAARPRSR
jgi:LysR family glycine cleavage system transcriptional activator